MVRDKPLDGIGVHASDEDTQRLYETARGVEITRDIDRATPRERFCALEALEWVITEIEDTHMRILQNACGDKHWATENEATK